MSTDIEVVLSSLECGDERDASGHSEPYIWTAALWVDRETASVDVSPSSVGHARVVIKSDMRAGDVAAIPSSVGLLRRRVATVADVRALVLVVAMWEHDETPEKAVQAGYSVFAPELRTAVAANVLGLDSSDKDIRQAAIDAVRSKVKSRVEDAVEGALTTSEKARIALGTLNLDDEVASSFMSFEDGEISEGGFTLLFRSADSKNTYYIHGSLRVEPVEEDRCQAQLDAFQAATTAVSEIEAELDALGQELEGASPTRKAAILRKTLRLTRQELPAANAKLERAQAALRICRNGAPAAF